MIKTNEFQLCLEFVTGKKENPKVEKLLYFVGLQEITKLKQRILGASCIL